MEDITAALCLDKRLRLWLYPTSITNRGSRGIFVFIRPSLLHLLSLPPYPSSHSVIPLISLRYSLSANGACLQGGHQIHYQVGQLFPHFFFSLNCMRREGRKRKQTEATGEPRSAAFESGLWKTKHNKLLLKKAVIVSITYRVVINIAFKLLNTVIFAESLWLCYDHVL